MNFFSRRLHQRCCCVIVKVVESPRDAPFFLYVATAAGVIVWNVNQQIAFSSIVRGKMEREMGNEIKMNLDTLIDFNCSVSHFMEVVVGVNHIGHSHRHRCNDNNNNDDKRNIQRIRCA